MPRERLDKLLVDRGLAASRHRATALVMSGDVLVAGHAADKPGAMVDTAAEITLRKPDHPYVSRGGLKLAKALDHFAIDLTPHSLPGNAARPGGAGAIDLTPHSLPGGAARPGGAGAIDPTGFTCLDIGASTGGFTDVLLRRGAARVYAIDVGYGQLAWSLRQDPRVVVLERHNVRSIDLDLVPEPCDLAVIDVSFISLTLVLGRVAELLRPPLGKPIIALVKPQFEAGRDQVSRGGVVRDESARLAAVEKVRTWATANGFAAGEYIESPITGPAGNVEYLLLLRTAAPISDRAIEPE